MSTPADTLSMVFQLAVTIILGAMLPWVIRVSRELGEIKAAIRAETAANAREAANVSDLTRRIGALEVKLAEARGGGHRFGDGDGA